MITVIDCGISNLGSVLSALRRVGVPARVTTEPAEVSEAERLLLPGVGAFADGMAALHRHRLVEPIRAHGAAGRPLIGVCLGMQLMAEGSDEFGRHEGLGLVPGWARRLPSGPGLRVPNIGWCDLAVRPSARLFAGTDATPSAYFVHSYALEGVPEANIAATIRFGDRDVVVALERGNIFGAQFHPEKSQDTGLAMLAAFAAVQGRAA